MKQLTIALMAAVLTLLSLAIPVGAAADEHDHHGDGAPHGQYGERGGGDRGGHYGGPGGGYGDPRFGGAPHDGPAPGYGGGDRFAPPPAYGHTPPYAPARPAYAAPRYREGYQDLAPLSGGRLRRGQFLPPAERGYIVGDYYRYHLRRPPAGYYWYRSGGDFVLASVTSGLVFEVVAGDGY